MTVRISFPNIFGRNFSTSCCFVSIGLSIITEYGHPALEQVLQYHVLHEGIILHLINHKVLDILLRTPADENGISGKA